MAIALEYISAGQATFRIIADFGPNKRLAMVESTSMLTCFVRETVQTRNLLRPCTVVVAIDIT